jgi:heme-degrading monooxygenase HmoA
MTAIASTPDPPYVAVIFTAVRSGEDEEGYLKADAEMEAMAAEQPGYLGYEGGRGMTVSYWATEDDARAWKAVAEHATAQRLGRERWYSSYKVRVASVGRDYGWSRPAT